MKNALLKTLLVILAVAVVLYGAAAWTTPLAEQNAREEGLRTMRALLPGSVEFKESAYDGADEAVDWVCKADNGYVIQTTTKGYVGDVTLMVGVGNDGAVTGVSVRRMNETPGLGASARDDEAFLMQFLHTRGDAAVGENIDAMTGATVTTKAIVKGVNAAVGVVTGVDTNSGATEWGG